MTYAIEMLNITKDFPGIRANDNVTLRVKENTVHALLGENGAGKSTIMSILFEVTRSAHRSGGLFCLRQFDAGNLKGGP